MDAPMFPVSGAEQLTASEAMCPPLPNTSAITAYYHEVDHRVHNERSLNGPTSKLVKGTPYFG